ncbi:MAG: DEAD/DEAH box helicase family protein, partial [Candidatus Asgardarchaeia archaeon]
KDIQKIKSHTNGNVLGRAFNYFEKQHISLENLIAELKEEFSEEKCMLLDSNNVNEEKQLKLNSLEEENNEIRAIFAVNMLNEGWDVLNLFDIVRLYNTRDGSWTRDGHHYKPGNTTLSEAQLIGRGARYFPFKLKEEDDKFKRKFDQEPENDMKIAEELYYHSTYTPRYIAELTATLRSTGILPTQEPKTIHLKVKESIKETDFWKRGFIFVNERVKKDRSQIKNINDIDVSKTYDPIKLRTGFTRDRAIFVEDAKPEENKITKSFKIKSFSSAIIRKALSKLEFYKFNNLQKYFPKLNSMNEFIESLKQISVDIRSSNKRLNNLTPDDKLEVCVNILIQLESRIRANYTEYRGTRLFIENNVENVVKDKTLHINVGDFGDQEYGEPMSNPKHENLRLNLFNKDWYVYDENYGTLEEKGFIQFINGVMKKLEKKYSEIYLLRNAYLFKIYRFSDGKPMEPDFVLFLKEKDKQKMMQYQLFVEAKGTHLLASPNEKWKGDFLGEIEPEYGIEPTLFEENNKYRIIGLPFYNEDTKINFKNVFNDTLDLDDEM